MFLDFLLYLRSGGFKVTLHDWLSLLEGLRKGYHGQTIRGFFVLCRTLLVKTETDLDKFEELFYQYFKNVSSEDLRRELEELFHHPEIADEIFAEYADMKGTNPVAMRAALEARIGETEGSALNLQSADANAPVRANPNGSMGALPGHGNGGQMQGAGGKSIVHARGDRKFRDWRTDSTIESRQFQMAFRLLRELSRKLNTQEEELDITGTINSTCRQGGILDIKMQPPRRNKLKVMILIDSGGSMRPYEQLCSLLFQSLHKANTFSDLKIYYFHNCLESVVYKDPSIDTEEVIKTEWILRNISGDYRVIFVGDADMAIHELMDTSYNPYSSETRSDGITWFRRFKEKYEHSIWLHPQEREDNPMWMPESFVEIEKVFPMFRLSIDGLKDGMYKLMRNN